MQQITPELRRWIVEQASAGVRPDDVLTAMRQAGWQEAVAVAAMESALSEHLAAKQAAAQAASTTGAVSAVPMLNLAGAPRRLDAGDRWVDVIASLQNPRVVVLGNLLSETECEALIESARPRLARSLTVQTQTGGEELNPDRTSSGMFFGRGETELVRRLEARIARLLRWPIEYGEGLQVLHYPEGGEYKPHYDYFDPGEPGTPALTRRGGQRLATVLIYLNQVPRGGATTFPDLGLEVLPQCGQALYFAYERPHPSTRTLHGSVPVWEGEKWIATKWLREHTFV